MPKQIYTVELDGKQYDLEGDRPPTEAEARAAVASMPAGDTYSGPDTFREGFTQSLKDTATRAAKEAGGAILSALDPRNLIATAQSAQRTMGAFVPGTPIPLVRAQGTLSGLASGARDMASAAVDEARRVVSGDPEAGGRALGTILTGVVGPKAVRGAASYAGPRLQSAGTTLYERVLKPNRGTIDSMTRFGSTNAERSRNIARQLLEDGATVDRKGADAFDAATRSKIEQVNQIVEANPEARGSTRLLVDALNDGRATPSNQWAASADTSAYDRVAKDALNNPSIRKTQRTRVDTSLEQQLGLAPEASEVRKTGTTLIPRVTARTARRLTQGTYRNLSDKAYGELQGPAVEANKAAARGGRAILNEAIPQVEPLNNDIARRIDLGQVLDEAALRGGKHDVVSLGQTVAASGQRPALTMLSALSRPGMGSRLARGLFNRGANLNAVGAMGPTGENLLRAALLQQMLQNAGQTGGNQ